MKKQTWFSKIIAIICVITVVTSSMELAILAGGNPATQSTDATYTKLGVEDFFDVQEHTVKYENGTAGDEQKKIGNDYLDGVMIDGIYRLSGNAIIDMGGRWNGFQISRTATDTLRYEIVGSGTYETVTEEKAQCALFDEDVRISVGFSLLNENTQTGKVDVVVVIKIGDTYTDVLTANSLNKSAFQRFVLLYAKDNVSFTGTSITWKATADTPELPIIQNDSEYTPMTFENFGITEDYTVSGTGEGVSGGTGRLGGIMVDGTYRLSGNAIVDIGGRWNGLQISRTATDTMRYELVGTGKYKTVTEEQANCTLFDEDVRIRVGFLFLNENTQAKTADVVAVIKIGDTYTNVLTYKGASTDRYQKYMYLYAVDNANFTGSSLTCRVIKEQEPEPPVIPEDSEYTPMTFENFGITEDYKVAGTGAGVSGGTGTLNGVMIDGTYCLSGNAVIDFGGQWKGFQISRTATDTLRYEIIGSGTYKTVTEEQADCTLFDEDVRIRVGFSFAKEEPNAGTADVTVVIKIGDTYADVLTMEGAIATNFQKYMYLYAVDKGNFTNSSVTCRVIKEEPPLPPVIPDDSEYTIMTSENFGVTRDYKVAGTGAGVSGGTGTLDGMMIDGTYSLSGNAVIDFGGQWKGFQISRTATDTLRYEIIGSGTYKTLTEEQANCTLFDDNVRIRVGFKFANENTQSKTADVTVVIKIGDTYADVLTAEGISTVGFQKYIYLYAVDKGNFTNSSVILRAVEREPIVIPKDSEYTKMTFADFGIRKDYTLSGKSSGISGGTGTLNGIMIDGFYYLSGNTIIDMGGQWKGFQISRTGENTLRYEIVGSGVYKTVTEEQAGCKLFDQDVRLRVGFKFIKENTKNQTADVSVVFKIGDVYADVITAEGISTVGLQKYMYLYAVDNTLFTDSSLTLKATGIDPLVIPKDSEYTKMTFDDFGITGNYKVKGEGTGVSGGTGNLNGIMIDGTYYLSGNAIVDIGGRWKGFQISRAGEDSLRYELVGSGKYVTVTSDDTGCTLFDKDVRIRVGFTFSKVNKKTKTANVSVVVKIGDAYADIMTAEGISTDDFQKYMYLYAVDNENYKNSCVILRGIQEAPDKMDSMEIQYTTPLTFFDFEITNDYTVKDGSSELMAGLGYLDGVVIDGTYHLSGNTIIDFGARWKGLQIQRQGTDRLRYQFLDTNGEGKEYTAYSKDITSEDTGCALFDADVQIKVGFNFVKLNKKKGTADVMIEVNIGPTYRDVFVVKGVSIANLRTMMFLYAVDGNGYTGSKVILRKPYMEPFDIREFGFTENWKVELKLKGR